MEMINTYQTAIEGIVELFSNPAKVRNLPEMTAQAVINPTDKPSAKWSFLNQFGMMIQGTMDARTYLQWKDVGRYVKRGAKAIYILAPVTIKVVDKDENGDEIEGTERMVLRGFKGLPVFRIEDTDGAPLKTYEPKTLPPLMDVAEAWGITLRYENIRGELGHIDLGKDEIVLGTERTATFFHELAHAAQKRNGTIKGGQDAEEEATAELVAAVLTHLYGGQVDKFAWNYIARYGGAKTPEQVGKMCMRIMSKVEAVLKTILESRPQVVMVRR